MNDRTSITAIIPAFNAEDTIGDAIQSALGQACRTCALIELIVVDDCSTDDTAKVVESLTDPRVRLVKSTRNLGPAAARNRGAADATGEYLAFLDADDIWLPDKLEQQCAALQSDPGAAAAYGWADVVGADGTFAYADQRVTHSGRVYEELLRGNFIFSGSNLMVRRTAFEEVGGFDSTLRAVEDWELHVRLAKTYPFVCVPAVVVHYRQTVGSLSGQLATMESAYHNAAQSVFGAADSRQEPVRRQGLAAFYLYLAMRATQQGWHPKHWFNFVRYAATAFWYRPAVYVDLLRGRSPLASLRLSLRALHEKRPTG